MKYVIVIGDGMADYPLEELNGETPLQRAKTPNMDYIASHGVSGMLRNVPADLKPGSDVANLSVLGYNPEKFYTGRGPLEAPSVGAELESGDVAFRCNFITEANGLLEDFNADHISTEEASKLINTLNEVMDLSNGKYPEPEKHHKPGKFYVGTSYRNLFVYRDEKSAALESAPPHDVVGEPISENLLKPSEDENAQILNKLMLQSRKVLENHPVNKGRAETDKKPANMVWLWGQGVKPSMPQFSEEYGLKGAAITGVDLIKGIGIYMGLTVVNVPGATGYYDTDYDAKAKYALEALKNHDLVFIHVEAPDEAGHAGDITEKIRAIENIDKKILGTLLKNLPEFGNYAVAVLPDHPTPVHVKTHTRDPVPYSMFSTNADPDGIEKYDEISAKNGSQGVMEGHKFMKSFMDYANST
jgi:2,3-bisphosphoglycerate-independent phosphoglycerate mutase